MKIGEGPSIESIALLLALRRLENAGRLPTTPGTGKRPTERPAPACRPFDSAQCRIWLNEAQREIDRLRRSTASPVALRAGQPHQPDAQLRDPCDDAPPRQDSQPDQIRLYAVTPIGALELPDRAAPPQSRVIALTRVMQVTNLGTLIDALA